MTPKGFILPTQKRYYYNTHIAETTVQCTPLSDPDFLIRRILKNRILQLKSISSLIATQNRVKTILFSLQVQFEEKKYFYIF